MKAHYRCSVQDTAQIEDNCVHIISHTSERALAEHSVLNMHLILLFPVTAFSIKKAEFIRHIYSNKSDRDYHKDSYRTVTYYTLSGASNAVMFFRIMIAVTLLTDKIIFLWPGPRLLEAVGIQKKKTTRSCKRAKNVIL